jgi:hypothetical protein
MRNNYYLINKFLLEADTTNAANHKFDVAKAMQTVSPNPNDSPALRSLKERAKKIILKIKSIGMGIKNLYFGTIYRILAKIAYLSGSRFQFEVYVVAYTFTTGKKLEWAEKIMLSKDYPTKWKKS